MSQRKKEQRALIRFLWSEWVQVAEIHGRLLPQYGKSNPTQRKVYEWLELFINGRTSVVDE
jgi:hypothetical protein